MVLASLLLLAPAAALAAWNPTGSPVCIAPGFQGNLIAVPKPVEFETFHSQSMVALWDDARDTVAAGSNLFFQVIDPTGPPDPTDNGTPGVVAPGFQGNADACLVGPGGGDIVTDMGIVVAWNDNRNGALDVYARRVIDSPFSTPWPAEGVPVCTAPGAQYVIHAVGDIHAGTTISWLDQRDGLNAIFAQHLDTNGVPQWAANGVPVCGVPGYRYQHQLASDFDGGAFSVWIDDQSGPLRVYAARLLPNGNRAPGWPAGGRMISSLPASQLGPVLPDFRSGYYVTFFSGSGLPIACRVDSGGQIHAGWPADGVALAQTPFDGFLNDVVRMNDGIAALWQKNILPPGDTFEYDLFAQRLLDDGTRPAGWGPEGNVVCDAPGDQINGRLAVGSGITAVWEDSRPGTIGPDLYAMHLMDNGATGFEWPANGIPFATGNGRQFSPRPVWDGTAGVMVAYLDDHNFDSFETDVYAQRVNLNATIGTTAVPLGGAAAFRLSAPFPNPARGLVTLQLAGARGPVSAEVLDPLGRRVRTLAPADPSTVRWDLADDAGQRVGPGIYYVRAHDAKETATRAVVVRR
jgi:hypothetical protein